MVRLAWLLAGIAVLAAACGGGTKTTIQPDATFTPAGSATTAATPAPTQTPAPSPSATPTVSASAALDAAFNAGLGIFDAVSNDDCKTNNPQGKACLVKDAHPADASRGAAAFELGFPQGGGATVVLGRTADGGWGYWYGTQQQIFRSYALPTDMLVCGFGAGTVVRAAADGASASVASLPDLAKVRAEEFLLTNPGTYGKTNGGGWYRISAPNAGWVRSTAVADANNGDCKLHDAIERTVG